MSNHSWREQAKPVTATPTESGLPILHFASEWQAVQWVIDQRHCARLTARKEIRRSIHHAVPRYGYLWQFAPVPDGSAAAPVPDGSAANALVPDGSAAATTPD